MPNNPWGFWIRFLALILDALTVGIPLSILSYLIFGVVEDGFTGVIDI